MRAASLPNPEPGAAAQCAALRERIAADLRAGGDWLSFAHYMGLALYAPGLGYYAAGAPKFGRGGDFVTAPELGDLFARTLARQLAPLLEPGDAVLEFGAGSGALASQLLAELERLGQRPPYWILETSPALAARQRERLGARARWITRLPEEFRGVMLANEVVDAMPAHVVAWTDAGIREQGVCLNEGEFAWCARPARGAVLEAARELPVQAPYTSEIGLAARAWVAALAGALERGVLFIIDYGFPREVYYHPQRSTGTLMCHYRHHAHADPFFLPGLQDITVHVDFTALADAGASAGLDSLGFATLAQFLVNCGITDVMSDADPGDVRRYAPLAAQANRLLSPAEMGELFKVLALGRGVSSPLLGFAPRAMRGAGA